MFLCGRVFAGTAWAGKPKPNLGSLALQRNTNDLPDSQTSSTLNLDTPLGSPTFPLTDLYTVDAQEISPSNYIDPTHSNGQFEVLYLAAPENLNPGLYRPPSAIPSPESITPEPVTPDPEEPESDETPIVPIWDIDGLTIDLSDNFSNFSQGNRIVEPTVTGNLPNGDRLAVTMGLNRFTQPDIQTVFNAPLKATWTGEVGDFTTTVGGGVDFFNQLPVAINLNASTSVPIGEQAVLSFFVDHGPYKFNATTLTNQITAWRYGPNLYWQIAPDLSFFSLVRWGRYNDGNQEQQSFSRLEKKVGDFSVAANVFTWRYRENVESTSGYFSPPDFLVSTGEIGWSGEVLRGLDCRAAASVGQQRLSGTWSSAYGYNAQCTFQMAESLEMDLGYAFSNVIGQTGGSAFNNRAITGRIRAQF